MDNTIIRFLNEVIIMSVHTWLIYSAYNHVTHGIDPTFQLLGQITIILGLGFTLGLGFNLLCYLTGLNL